MYSTRILQIPIQIYLYKKKIKIQNMNIETSYSIFYQNFLNLVIKASLVKDYYLS